MLGNLTSLCKFHHFQVHEGGFGVEAASGGGFRFLRPDGSEIVAAPPVPAVHGDPQARLREEWIPQAVTIDEHTGRPTWWGEPADYEWAILSLDHCKARDKGPSKYQQIE